MHVRSTGSGGPLGPDVPGIAGPSGVDRAIAELNIEYFRKLLDEELDEAKRQIIERLLEEEEAKLASLDNEPEPPEQEE